MSLTGWESVVQPVELDENPLSGETGAAMSRRLARAKARAVIAQQAADGLVLAADTVVVDGARMLGKPADETEARAMLLGLRGRPHRVITSLALVDPASGRERIEICETEVPMRTYDAAEMEAYLASGSPLDKAGAYGIQDGGFNPVALERMTGCFANVMGLPLCHLVRAMSAFGERPPSDVPATCREHTGYPCRVYPEILEGAQ